MPRLHPLEAHILRAIRQQHLISPAETVVVAVSGGVDSLALLHILHRLAPRLGCTLHVATLDHGLRGQAGADDAAFVAAEAERLGLPCSVGRDDVPALMQTDRLGVETAARRARYTFLAQTAQTVGARLVATAHHADDQAETILMRLIRGTALRGLAGMRVSAPLPEVDAPALRLIRPLLDVRRRQIEAYAAQRGLAARDDATNRQPTTLRNAIRRTILRRFPTLTPHLVQIATLAQIDEAYFAEQIARQVGDGFSWDGQRVQIVRAPFIDLPRAFQLRIMAAALRQAAPRVTIPFQHILACCDATVGGRVGKAVQLEDGWRLRVDYTTVYIERAHEAALPSDQVVMPSADGLPIIIPGVTAVPGAGWRMRTALDASPRANAILFVPAGAQVMLRTRRPGDRFAPPGLGGHRQKLKQWMIDRKLPQAARDGIPLIEIDGQIAAIMWGERWPVNPHFSSDDSGRQRVAFTLEIEVPPNKATSMK
jgi:tRNA(Ile)-lysidine synthase